MQDYYDVGAKLGAGKNTPKHPQCLPGSKNTQKIICVRVGEEGVGKSEEWGQSWKNTNLAHESPF